MLSEQEHLDNYLAPEQKLRMESLRKEARQLGGDAIRQQLEGEGSLLWQLQQEQQQQQQQQQLEQGDDSQPSGGSRPS